MGSKGAAPSVGHSVPLGKANIVREGGDVTLIGYGRPMIDAAIAAEALAKEGVAVELIDLRSIVPFDQDTVLNSVAKTGRAVILHEAVRSFGVGAEISARINEQLFGQLKAPVQRIGGPDSPGPRSEEHTSEH